MPLLSLGNLEKMKIIAFTDSKFVAPISSYVAMFNPIEFIETKNIELNTNEVIGAKEKFKFNHTKADDFSVKFFIDGTGATKVGGGGSPALIVQSNISLFKATVSGGFGLKISKAMKESHETPFLILQWGKFVYKCRCIKYTITYTLFNPVGLPIRAEINATFKEVDSNSALSALTTFLSPDLTKTAVFKEGDSLPLLAEKEYGDPGLYLEVARANNMTNFRNIKPGTIIAFPPIDKN
jgi:nucleoid-associated protein YgaU